MAIWFRIRDRRAKERGEAVPSEEDEEEHQPSCGAQANTERSPLLRRTTGGKADTKAGDV